MCQVLFILFPQKHLVRGQLLGGSHDTAAGVVRHGTARYGTVRGHYGWHRAQQTRTPSQCSEGAHPASHLPLETAPSRARPSVFAPPPPSPRPVQQIATTRAGGPARRGGAACPRSWQARRQGGGCARAARLAPAGVSVPRAIYTLYKYLQREEWRGRRPAGGTLRLCTCHRRGEAVAVRGAGALLRGAAPGIPVPQPPACPQPWAPAELPARDLPQQSVGFPRQPGPRSQVHKSAKSFQYSDGLMEKKKRKVQAKNSKH